MAVRIVRNAFHVCLILGTLPGALHGATHVSGFGQSEETESVPDTTVASQPPASSYVKTPGTPPALIGVKWLRLPFDHAENEVLALLAHDFNRIEKLTSELVVFEIKTSGELPGSYAQQFRAKLEQTLMVSNKIRVKQCSSCQQARIVKNEDGEIRYETQNQDATRAKKTARELGVRHLLYAELVYSPSDLLLQTRLVDSETGEILLTGNYSTADVVKNRKQLISKEYRYEVGHQDSLARVLIGEVAFTTVFAPGFMWLPTLGGGHAFYPSADLLLGEKYNSGHNRFGFVIGAGASIVKDASLAPLPFLIRVAPHFRYTFNPYNISNIQWSMTQELGACIGTGLVTAYLGVGLEAAMIKRFSLSFVPLFILPAEVGGTMMQIQNADGSFSSSQGPGQGHFGGLGAVVKLNINW